MTQNQPDFAFRPTRLMPGLILAAVGIFLLLQNFDLIPDWDWTTMWPLLLIGWGVLMLIDRLCGAGMSARRSWRAQGWEQSCGRRLGGDPAGSAPSKS